MMYLQKAFTVPAALSKISGCEACVYGRGGHAMWCQEGLVLDPNRVTAEYRVSELEWLTMDRSVFLKRFYAIVGGGSCVLLALAWVYIEGGLSPRGLAVAALIYWIAMFASLFLLIRSRQRSVEDIRRRQIASGVPIEEIDRERCVRNIRSMKRVIAVFAVLLGYGMLTTQGEPLLPRAVGAAIVSFFLAASIRSLMRSQKKLKALQQIVQQGPST